MIDIHCHILPGVDDGSPDFETSLEMARLAEDSGVTDIIATPHCNNPGGPYNYREEPLLAQFDELNERLAQEGVEVTIHPGAEVLARENLPRLLDDGKLTTLNHSRYLLVEFFFDVSPSFIFQSIEAIHRVGLVPVIAHPERYSAVQAEPMMCVDWFQDGCILQMNKGSLLGRLGRGAFQASNWMLEHGLAHVIASDGHSSTFRTTDMSQLTALLYDRCPMDYVDMLLNENPKRILRDNPIPIPGFE